MGTHGRVRFQSNQGVSNVDTRAVVRAERGHTPIAEHIYVMHGQVPQRSRGGVVRQTKSFAAQDKELTYLRVFTLALFHACGRLRGGWVGVWGWAGG